MAQRLTRALTVEIIARIRPLPMRFYLFLFLGLVLLMPWRAAIGATFSVRRISISEGLPHAAVQAIEITTEGRVWMATRGGLARYDGRRLETFTRVNFGAFAKSDDCVDLL